MKETGCRIWRDASSGGALYQFVRHAARTMRESRCETNWTHQPHRKHPHLLAHALHKRHHLDTCTTSQIHTCRCPQPQKLTATSRTHSNSNSNSPHKHKLRLKLTATSCTNSSNPRFAATAGVSARNGNAPASVPETVTRQCQKRYRACVPRSDCVPRLHWMCWPL